MAWKHEKADLGLRQGEAERTMMMEGVNALPNLVSTLNLNVKMSMY